jgi:cobalt-zinc-cadmium efflux system membrane fusion protein
LPPFSGVLAVDSNRLARVHPRFAGEVVALGTVKALEVTAATPDSSSYGRPLRFGDRVTKDQLLAVVWSKDLGEKKSELVDAVSRLKLDRDVRDRLQEAYRAGAAAERSVREAERNVESDLIAVAKAERTLRAWRLTEAEIAAVREEAERIRKDKGRTSPDDERWARVEVRSPQDGVILEKNINIGDLVDMTTDLFRVGRLDRLTVWAHIYEEDLALLQKLPRPLTWTVRLPSQPDKSYAGSLEQIGALIDPNQHTALASGEVDNSAGELRAGQYVTVTVELPPAADEVEVPTSALVEDGRSSVIFVKNDSGELHFARRRVAVVRRCYDIVYLQANPKGLPPLRPGEQVVASGTIFLNDALAELPLPKP